MELGAFPVTPVPYGVAGLPQSLRREALQRRRRGASEGGSEQRSERYAPVRHQARDCHTGLGGLGVSFGSCSRPVSCTKQIPRGLLGRMELATRGTTRRAGQRSRFLLLPLAPPPRRCPRLTADTESHCISTASIRAGGGHPSRSCGGHGIACGMELKL
jgi:hypothetical protein